MASFPPLKTYMLSLLDELIERHGLNGPFLDFGSGTGDVAAHVARRGWEGIAVDTSETARALTAAALRPFPRVRVSSEIDGGPYATALMMDVLEHVPDDRAALAEVAARQGADGFLVITVPTNERREWRWDDDFYGHLRRYEPGALSDILGAAGYRVLEVWDATFPVFWLMRRGYTAIKRRPVLRGSASERTAASASGQAWELGLISSLLSFPTPPVWRPIFALQRLFRNHPRAGHEAMVLARRIAR